MDYSWAQFLTYLRLARRRRARAQLDQLVIQSQAFAGGDKARELARLLADEARGRGEG